MVRPVPVMLALVAGLLLGSSTARAAPPLPGSLPAPAVTTPQASAQPDTLIEVRGSVLDEAGRPVRAARLQLSGAGRVVGYAISDVRGHFRIRFPDTGFPVLVLQVDRLGYEGIELALQPIAEQEVRVELVPAPLPLPGIQIEGRGPVCEESHPEALELWQAVAANHVRDLDTLGVATYTLARTDTLDTMRPARPIQATAAELVPGQRGSAPLLRYSWERRVEREGYAFPVRRTNRDGSYASWSYAPLEADFAEHFLAPSFLERHHLRAPVDTGDGGWELAFCPVDPDRPSLEGRFEITPDSLLLRAEWSFFTPDPDERAGGWAIFPPPAPEQLPRVLPSQSLTWKELPDGRIQRRAQWYEDWLLAPGDSVPFLPHRRNDDSPGAAGSGG